MNTKKKVSLHSTQNKNVKQENRLFVCIIYNDLDTNTCTYAHTQTHTAHIYTHKYINSHTHTHTHTRVPLLPSEFPQSCISFYRKH